MGTACSSGKEVEDQERASCRSKGRLLVSAEATHQNVQPNSASAAATHTDGGAISFSDVMSVATSRDVDKEDASTKNMATNRYFAAAPPPCGDQPRRETNDQQHHHPLFASTFVLSSNDDEDDTGGDKSSSSSLLSTPIDKRLGKRNIPTTITNSEELPLCSRRATTDEEVPSHCENQAEELFPFPDYCPTTNQTNNAFLFAQVGGGVAAFNDDNDDDDDDVVPPASFDDDSENGDETVTTTNGVTTNPLLAPHTPRTATANAKPNPTPTLYQQWLSKRQAKSATAFDGGDMLDDSCGAPLPTAWCLGDRERSSTTSSNGNSNSGSSHNEFSDLVKSLRVNSVGPLVCTNMSSSVSASSSCRCCGPPTRGEEEEYRLTVDDDDEEEEEEDVEDVCHCHNDDEEKGSLVEQQQEEPTIVTGASCPENWATSKKRATDDDDDDDNLTDKDDRNDLSSEEGGDGSSGNYYANGLFHQPSFYKLSNPANTEPLHNIQQLQQHCLRETNAVGTNNTSSPSAASFHRRRHPPFSDSGSIISGGGGALIVASGGTSSVTSSLLFSPTMRSHTMCELPAASETTWEVLP